MSRYHSFVNYYKEIYGSKTSTKTSNRWFFLSGNSNKNGLSTKYRVSVLPVEVWPACAVTAFAMCHFLARDDYNASLF